MADPKAQLLSFPLDIGIDQNADPETVQPFGDRPRLVSSTNTRLTATRGRVAKAPARTPLGASLRRCGGIVPSRTYDSAVAFFHPGDDGNRRIENGVVGLLTSVANNASPQNSYYPLAVSRAGALPAGAALYWKSDVAHDTSTGYTYYATIGYTASSGTAVNYIAITVLGSAGQLVCAPTRVVVYGSTISNPFLALTAFPGQVTLWYKSTSTNAILAARITVSTTTLTLGSPSTIYTPGSIAIGSAALTYDQADTSNVYLICFQSASNNARLLRVNPTTLTVSTGLDVATGGDAASKHAIAYVHDGTSGQLIWMVSWAAGNCTLFAANPTTLATSWAQPNRLWWADEGTVSCGFYKIATPFSLNVAVFAATRQGTVASTATPGGTAVEAREYAGGALTVTTQIPWYQMVAPICTVKVESTTQWYSVFSVMPYYANVGRNDPTDVNFISDPSVELMRLRYDAGPTAYFDMLGRVGTDMVWRHPTTPAILNGCAYVAATKRMLLTYAAADGDGISRGDGLVARYVDFDWTPACPKQALLAGGQAVVAAAQPVCWDGAEITEFQPSRAPKITGSATGGSGDTLTGTYRFAAVISWRDSAGTVHRGPPSNIITLSPAATAVRLWVTAPVTYANRVTQGSFSVTIYASQDGGTVLYAQPITDDVAASTAYWVAFTNVYDPVQNALTPALYSDGSATQIKIPYAPNAARDAKVIGDRLWLLDAELNRAYYSQPLSTEALAGMFPAMNPTQYVNFPAAAGTVVAMENWKEAPLFFSSTGVWTVDGEGPDALNDPPYFAQPRQLSDVPCTDAGSVALTPVGVIFRSGNRFALAGGSFAVMDDALANIDVIGVAVFRDQHEIVVFESTGVAHVFNYLKQAWTTWDANVFSSSGAISCVAQDPWTGKALYFSDSATALFSMDPATTSTTAQMSMSTGWVIFGNPQEDCTLQGWYARCARGGAHGVDMAVGVDYQANQPTKSYSSTEVTNATTNGRYDLWPEPRDMPARAAKLTITETGAAGEGMQPINVTYEVIRNTGKKSSSLRQSGRK